MRYNHAMTRGHDASRHRALGLALGLGVCSVLAGAALAQAPSQAALPPLERRALLDALRPQAAQRAGQPVKFVVERLNVDGDWALLTGALVSASGGPLVWSKAAECHPELDKLLWAVAARQGGAWQLKHLEVCATEPPHWTLEQFGGFAWPCGLYAGLEGPTGQDLAAACRRDRAAQPAAAPAAKP